jgi:hypothetical protein
MCCGSVCRSRVASVLHLLQFNKLLALLTAWLCPASLAGDRPTAIVLPWRWDETPDMSYTSFCPSSANLGLQPQEDPQQIQSQDRARCSFVWEVCVMMMRRTTTMRIPMMIMMMTIKMMMTTTRRNMMMW